MVFGKNPFSLNYFRGHTNVFLLISSKFDHLPSSNRRFTFSLTCFIINLTHNSVSISTETNPTFPGGMGKDIEKFEVTQGGRENPQI